MSYGESIKFWLMWPGVPLDAAVVLTLGEDSEDFEEHDSQAFNLLKALAISHARAGNVCFVVEGDPKASPLDICVRLADFGAWAENMGYELRPEFPRPDVSPADATPLRDDRKGISDALVLLNRASRHWWENADKNDPCTHPKNSDVAAWLIEKGMTKSLAERAASIIRPEWAHTGRKPDA